MRLGINIIWIDEAFHTARARQSTGEKVDQLAFSSHHTPHTVYMVLYALENEHFSELEVSHHFREKNVFNGTCITIGSFAFFTCVVSHVGHPAHPLFFISTSLRADSVLLEKEICNFNPLVCNKREKRGILLSNGNIGHVEQYGMQNMEQVKSLFHTDNMISACLPHNESQRRITKGHKSQVFYGIASLHKGYREA